MESMAAYIRSVGKKFFFSMHYHLKKEKVFKLNKKQWYRYYLFSYGGIFISTFIFYNQIVLSFILGFLSIFGGNHYRVYRLKQEKFQVTQQFRDALQVFSSTLSAGKSMEVAVGIAAENLTLIYGETCFLSRVFKALIEKSKNTNTSMEQLLMEFGQEMEIEDISNFIDIYSISIHTGGNLEEIISRTSKILIDKSMVMKDIHVITAQKKFESKILTLIPFITIVFLRIMAPDYLVSLYTTGQGRLIMTIGLLGIGFSYYLCNKITNIKV